MLRKAFRAVRHLFVHRYLTCAYSHVYHNNHWYYSLRIDDIQEYTRSSSFSYCRQLDLIKELVSTKKRSVKPVIQNIGNDVSAMTAVPAAIISFLHNVEKGFQEILYYSISLGGDTDTIASMACAIAGAFYGEEVIPDPWKSKCEDSLILSDFGKKFHELRFPKPLKTFV